MIRQFYKTWWKWLTAGLILFVVVAGMLVEVPNREVLRETIRNLFYHVPLWFGVTIMLTINLVYSIKYLRSGDLKHDRMAAAMVSASLLFGALGFITGAIWGHFTWGDMASWLPREPKVLGALLGVLIYAAYAVLRDSIEDPERKARVAAVFSVLGYAMFIMFIWVVPRLVPDSLHPDSGGNSGFEPLDSQQHDLRRIFWLAVPAWTLLGIWLASLNFRYRTIKAAAHEN